jgi:hypothetical protein
MEPKKKIKKFNGFKTKKQIEFIPPGICDVHEPRLRYRYLMEFPLGDTMFECWVNTELPSVSLRTGNLGFGLTHYRQEWEPIQVKIRDIIGDDENRRLFYDRIDNWFSDYNYTGRRINSTISRIDPTGVTVDRWGLRGCFISAIHYTNGYLDNVEPEIEITLHYDYCNLNLGI